MSILICKFSRAKTPFVLAWIWIGLGLVSCRGGKVQSISNSDPDAVRSAGEVVVAAGDWPWWSGPQRNFVSQCQKIPLEFDENTNCQWSCPTPGEGHSSPIVVGERLFVTVADRVAKTKSLCCLARASGELLWSTTVHQGGFMYTHEKNSQASATPASDGQRVFTAFMFDNGIQVSAVDFDGEILWQTTAGDYQSVHGYGSSPVLYRSLVIVAGDNPRSGFVTAMDRGTGDIVWRIDRQKESSYCTPTIVNVNGEDQLLLSGSGQVIGYDPASGRKLWSSEGPAKCTANTVVTDGQLVFAGGGYPENRFLCIDPRSEEVRWQVNLKSYVPSPLLVGNDVVIPQDGGILASFRKDTGDLNWKIRLSEDLSGSGVLVDRRLYLGGERGTMFVVDLSGSGRILARNRLDSRIMATPAICGEQLFVRTAKKLFCFANSSIGKVN